MSFATFGLGCFGLALLLLPLILLAAAPLLIMWSAFKDTERMWWETGRDLKL